MIEAILGYINQADEAHQEDLVHVYETIRSVLPDVPERLNWGIPTFGKNTIHFAEAKRHVGIHAGSDAVDYFEPILAEKGFKHTKSTIQMPYGKVDLDLVAAIAEFCRDRAKTDERVERSSHGTCL